MRVSVFGLGHAGSVTAACVADAGNVVVGVDPAVDRVAAVNSGRSPVREPGLDTLVAGAVGAGRLVATSSARDAVDACEVAFLCVGTPSRADGGLDVDHLARACEEIGDSLAGRTGPFTVVVRSTVLPGTTESLVIPRLERHSGRRLGDGLSVVVMPEFLREGTALEDFARPPRVVIGADDDRGYRAALEACSGGDSPVFRVPLRVAELIKYVDNTWHAVKVAFANEIGTIAVENGINGQDVMDVFCSDERLNLSRQYLRPGGPFGGSCLPKDVRALTRWTLEHALDLPLITAVLPSNARHLDRFYDAVVRHGCTRVAVIGLAFKQRTGDLRESPVVALVHRLLATGFDVRVHEPGLATGPGTPTYGLPLDRPGFLAHSLTDLLDEARTIVIGGGWTMTEDLAHELRSSGLPVVSMVG